METKDYQVYLEHGAIVFESKRTSPVVISVPHDGLIFQGFEGIFEKRKTGFKGRDRYVWPVAKDILVSTAANAVIGLMPRALIDYNRAWPVGINYYPKSQKEVHTALEDEGVLSAYEYYHASIDRLLARLEKNWGKNKALLIDLHGFSKQPPYAPEGGYDLILGTGNRASIPHGDIDFRLASFMESKGYKVFLPLSISLGPIEDWYSADFTTRHHSEKQNLNAIQIEIACRFRAKNAQQLGQKLSQDLAEFIDLHRT